MKSLLRLLGVRSRAARPDCRPAARLRVEPLEQRLTPTVSYYGGNLLPNVVAQAVYYGGEWSSPAAGQPTTAAVDAFLKDLTGGAYVQALSTAGYNVGPGTATAGVVDSAAPVNPGTRGVTITDASIQTRLQVDIKSSLVQSPDVGPTGQPLYVVYVEPNVAVNLGAGRGTTTQGILGYHSAFAGTDAAGNATTIRYAVVAYPGGRVGNSTYPSYLVHLSGPFDQLTAVTSHEAAEAVTDPDGGFAQIGWYDAQNRGEVADVMQLNPSAYVRLDGYLVQEVASQNDQLLALPPSPPPAGSVVTATSLTATVLANSRLPIATFTAVVSPSAPVGSTVTLVYQNQAVFTGQVQMVNGVDEVSFTIMFNAHGSYTLTAVFIGTGTYLPSTSNAVTVTV
jgi:hypothetical protein